MVPMHSFALIVLAVPIVFFLLYYVNSIISDKPMDPSSNALLREINKRCSILMEHIQSNGLARSDPVFRALFQRFRSGKIVGMPPGGDAAYTLDKGKEIRLCVPDNPELETATFVMLHELAHVATPERGHPPIFWKNFSKILEQAESAGIYRFQDFSTVSPGSYCGKRITYQPLRNGGQRPQANWNQGRYALSERFS